MKVVLLLCLLLMGSAITDEYEYSLMQTKQKLRKKKVQIFSISEGMTEADIQRQIDELRKQHPNLRVTKQALEPQEMMSFSQLGEQIKVDEVVQDIPMDIPVIPELDQIDNSNIVPLPIYIEPPGQVIPEQIAQAILESPALEQLVEEQITQTEKCSCKFSKKDNPSNPDKHIVVEQRCEGGLPQQQFTVTLSRDEMLDLLRYHQGIKDELMENDPLGADSKFSSFFQMGQNAGFELQGPLFYQQPQVQGQQRQMVMPQQVVVQQQPGINQQQLQQMQQQQIFSFLQQQQGLQTQPQQNLVYIQPGQQQYQQQQVIQQPQLIQQPQFQQQPQMIQQPQQQFIQVQQPQPQYQQVLVQQSPQQGFLQQQAPQPQQIIQNGVPVLVYPQNYQQQQVNHLVQSGYPQMTYIDQPQQFFPQQQVLSGQPMMRQY